MQTASLGSICFKVFEFSVTVIGQTGLGKTACEQVLSMKDVSQGLVEPGWEDRLGPRWQPGQELGKEVLAEPLDVLGPEVHG